MKIKYLSILSIFFLAFFSLSVSAFYDTAANVMQSGSPIQGGDLEIRVYDSASGGSQVCSQSFTNAINNGMWSVYVSNCDGELFYSEEYHKEYRISGQLIEFDGSERLSFISRYGRFGDLLVEGDLTVDDDVSAEAYYYHSDEVLKKNVDSLISPLSMVRSLQGVSFDWVRDGTQSIGFIAQDVKEIAPELVSEVSLGSDTILSVDYARMTPILVEAIKEQQSEIESLENRIDEQQEEIDELRLMIQELQ